MTLRTLRVLGLVALGSAAAVPSAIASPFLSEVPLSAVSLHPSEAAAKAHIKGQQFRLAQNPDKCLGKREFHANNGTQIETRPCGGAEEHTFFKYEPESGYLIVRDYPDQCLQARTGTFNVGNDIVIRDCTHNAPEFKTWDLKYNGQIRLRHAPTPLCMAKDTTSTLNWIDFALASCSNGHVNQTFEHDYFTPSEKFELTQNPLLCIGLHGGNTSVGTRAKLRICMGTFSGGGEGLIHDRLTGRLVLNRKKTRCLGRRNANANDGNPIEVRNCTDADADTQWDLGTDGLIHLRADPTKCIRKNGPNNDGTPLELWTCNPGSNWQTFEVPGKAPATVASLPAYPTSCGLTSGGALVKKQGSFGEEDKVAASYSITAGLADHTTWEDATQTSVASDFIYLGAEGDATAHLFGESVTIFGLGAKTVRENAQHSSEAYLVAVGQDLYRDSIGADYGYAVDATFLAVAATFYGVTVSGEIVGAIGFEANATASGVGMQINVQPYAGIVANASASVGGLCFEAGVESDLTVLDVKIPTSGAVSMTNGIKYDFETALELGTLNGKMNLFLNYCVDSKKHKLFSWPGTSTRFESGASGCIN